MRWLALGVAAEHLVARGCSQTAQNGLRRITQLKGNKAICSEYCE